MQLRAWATWEPNSLFCVPNPFLDEEAFCIVTDAAGCPTQLASDIRLADGHLLFVSLSCLSLFLSRPWLW